MYPKYFGLKEPSFSIAPDPHYLFLSEQHKEALAHLLYGAGESGGFVLLSGEVGTGKTTVCRVFLEQLPEVVDVALILNPAQSANELLTNICEEFRLSLPKGKLSNKMLVDRLNRYLLTAHARGRRPLLIIDEAQNLLPQALEQVRLLTNLETNKHKLLQIFLIGQPELRHMLERDRLRQLNQRITARYHLKPFSLRETGDYIRHRVAVGGVDRPLFSASAIRSIYRFSGGIPRLINILCDRALLGTCVSRGSQVTPAIVAQAAREVRGDPFEERPRSSLRLILVALGAFGLAVALALLINAFLGLSPGDLVAQLTERRDKPAQADQVVPMSAKTEPADAAGAASAVPSAADPAPPAPAAPAALAVPSETPSEPATAAPERLLARAVPKSEAARALLLRWGLELKTIGSDPCATLASFGLSCEEEQGRLSHVRFFGLPALLRVKGTEAPARYLALGELGETHAVLDRIGAAGERVPVEDLEQVWTGDYTLIWQLPPGGARVIGPGASGDDVRWLRALLAKVPDVTLLKSDSPFFDASMSTALRAFQAAKGLTPDGVAGPRTLIALQQAAAVPGAPHLSGAAAGAMASAPEEGP